MTMYIPASILRDAELDGYDCTLGGFSSKVNRIAVPAEGGYMTEDDCKAQGLIITEIHSNIPDHFHLREVGIKARPMFGGNFAYSSDSRFPSKQPLAIHDRFE